MRWGRFCGSLSILWHCLSLGLGVKTDLFQSCGHCWVFQICWHITCNAFIASSFSIWNSSTGIPSPRLALFVVILPKVHLTSHSRISGSRWLITPSWLSGSWRSFCTVFLQVPMQYCSLQHQTLLPTWVTSTMGCCFSLLPSLHSFWSYFSTDLQ